MALQYRQSKSNWKKNADSCGPFVRPKLYPNWKDAVSQWRFIIANLRTKGWMFSRGRGYVLEDGTYLGDERQMLVARLVNFCGIDTNGRRMGLMWKDFKKANGSSIISESDNQVWLRLDGTAFDIKCDLEKLIPAHAAALDLNQGCRQEPSSETTDNNVIPFLSLTPTTTLAARRLSSMSAVFLPSKFSVAPISKASVLARHDQAWHGPAALDLAMYAIGDASASMRTMPILRVGRAHELRLGPLVEVRRRGERVLVSVSSRPMSPGPPWSESHGYGRSGALLASGLGPSRLLIAVRRRVPKHIRPYHFICLSLLSRNAAPLTWNVFAERHISALVVVIKGCRAPPPSNLIGFCDINCGIATTTLSINLSSFQSRSVLTPTLLHSDSALFRQRRPERKTTCPEWFADATYSFPTPSTDKSAYLLPKHTHPTLGGTYCLESRERPTDVCGNSVLCAGLFFSRILQLSSLPTLNAAISGLSTLRYFPSISDSGQVSGPAMFNRLSALQLSMRKMSTYGQLQWTYTLVFTFTLLSVRPSPYRRLSFILPSLTLSATGAQNRARTFRRIIRDPALRHVTMSVWHGTAWSNASWLPITIDELGEGGQRTGGCLWIGPKRMARVVLFVHGFRWSVFAAGVGETASPRPVCDAQLHPHPKRTLPDSAQTNEAGFKVESRNRIPTS
ncbi:hypothetical protein FB45DRAFT_1135518 [Roridomyces roridus]|uniref:Uncharacterized protein n=1 Tax=Roridomyces roridus TaxID=1738132 RepID=A0AAD7B174_9AGAR|nr:hypothetical protein FB45DRAFT_1135518 [Roridomyces roridus]